MIFQWGLITYVHIEHLAIPATKPSEKKNSSILYYIGQYLTLDYALKWYLCAETFNYTQINYIKLCSQLAPVHYEC